MRALGNYSHKSPIRRIHINTNHFNFVAALQRLQKIAHISGTTPFNYSKFPAASQVTISGG